MLCSFKERGETMKQYTQQELKALSDKEALELCQEIRKHLIDNVTVTGGHLASNLGIVEISLALSRCFDLPKDKIIYDTGHQSYVHKTLTDRAESFDCLRQYGGISGFPKMEESGYDAFGVGHSSTGISAALGYAQSAKLKKTGAYSVAVIGDGAFTGGMVFEALNNVKRDDKLVIVLNDNEMSISPSVGALSGYLNKIRSGDGYYELMDKTRRAMMRIPLLGKPVAGAIIRLKTWLKRMMVAQSNLFEMYGIRYFGPGDGNDLKTVERLFRAAKRHQGPCIVHLYTVKGKGYEPAENDPSKFHSVGASKKKPAPKKQDFSSVVGETLCKMAEENPDLVAITAAMTDGVGLGDFAQSYPERFFDVGIAEEHAQTCAAAMAAGGLLPVFCVYSTFFQRAYDQFWHDCVLQSLRTVTVLDRAGLVGEDGPTHHGVYDVSMTMSMPGVYIYSPATYKEAAAALEKLCSRDHDIKSPAIVRVPKGSQGEKTALCFPCQEDIEVLGEGELCLVTYGRQTEKCLEARELLENEGIKTRLIKINRIKPLDVESFEKGIEKAKALLFCEEGMKTGGFSQWAVGEIATGRIKSDAQLMDICAIEGKVCHGKTDMLYQLCGLDKESIYKKAKELLSHES